MVVQVIPVPMPPMELFDDRLALHSPAASQVSTNLTDLLAQFNFVL